MATAPEAFQNASARPVQAENWIVNPTDLAALYEECSRCLYQHGRGLANIHPSKPPAVATVNDAMAAAMAQQKWIEAGVSPKFRVVHHRYEIGSEPMSFPGISSTLTFHGEIDAIVETANGQQYLAKYALTTDTDDTTYRYQRELAAYTYAVEHPDTPTLNPPMRVSGHVVIGFSALPAQQRGNEKIWIPVRWVELERRSDSFLSFMRVVARMLSAPHAPPASPNCPRCNKRRPGRDDATESGRLAV